MAIRIVIDIEIPPLIPSLPPSIEGSVLALRKKGKQNETR